jgi:hypothetical protein
MFLWFATQRFVLVGSTAIIFVAEATSVLKLEAVGSYVTLLLTYQRTTRRHNPEYSNVNIYCRESFNSYIPCHFASGPFISFLFLCCCFRYLYANFIYHVSLHMGRVIVEKKMSSKITLRLNTEGC